MPTKRILFVTDIHCGHVSGLTHPDYWLSVGRSLAWRNVQKTCWGNYCDWLSECGKPDILAIAGDLIDGRGERSGGRELISGCQKTQQEMALAALKRVSKPRLGAIGCYGTAYHAGKMFDYEDAIAEGIGATLHNVATFTVNGREFNLRHKTGGSDNPCGGDIALRKQLMGTLEWAYEHGGNPPPSIVRGHVHRWRRLDDAKREAVSLPGLQAWTIYGGRECSGLVQFGIAWCDVLENGETQWTQRTMPLGKITPAPIRF